MTRSTPDCHRKSATRLKFEQSAQTIVKASTLSRRTPGMPPASFDESHWIPASAEMRWSPVQKRNDHATCANNARRFSYASRAATSSRKHGNSSSDNACPASTSALFGTGCVHQEHIGPGNHALRRRVVHVRDAIWRALAGATECDGSTHTGMRVRRCTTGTCVKSTRLRCGSPKLVFMPRNPNTIFALPSDAQYSAP